MPSIRDFTQHGILSQIFTMLKERSREELREHLRQQIKDVVQSPDWQFAVQIFPSIRRIIKLRGRSLFTQQDFADVTYDAQSFAGLELSEDQIRAGLHAICELETLFYPYATAKALKITQSNYYSSKSQQSIDISKEVLSVAIWYKWDYQNDTDLIKFVFSQLYWLPKKIHDRSREIPVTDFLDDEGDISDLPENKSINWEESSINLAQPLGRLRDYLGSISLREIFNRIAYMSPREQILLLLVMGYLPEIKTFKDCVDHLGFSTRTAKLDFIQALDNSLMQPAGSTLLSANEIVEKALNEQINNIVGTSRAVSQSSPRLRLLTYVESTKELGGVWMRAFELLTQTEDGKFLYSVPEIAQMLGMTNPKSLYTIMNEIINRFEVGASDAETKWIVDQITKYMLNSGLNQVTVKGSTGRKLRVDSPRWHLIFLRAPASELNLEEQKLYFLATSRTEDRLLYHTDEIINRMGFRDKNHYNKKMLYLRNKCALLTFDDREEN